MDKAILLKTQLYEAAKFAKSSDFRYNRLAVILLDNFIEIQLRSKIIQEFHLDGTFRLPEKKYKQTDRQKILKNHSELLKTCVKENVITDEEKYLLTFCHDVRNNLYHKINEEKLLVTVALHILHDVIRVNQPEWKSASTFIFDYSMNKDPFKSRPIEASGFPYHFNSTEDWIYFLDTYFNFIDKRKSTASMLLCRDVILKIKKTRELFKFVNEEYSIYYPHTENWDFNDFVFHYAFLINNRDELEKIKELPTDQESKDKRRLLFLDFKSTWRVIKKDRLISLVKKAHEISKLSIYDCLIRYASIRDEVNLIFNSFSMAVNDLDEAIQCAVDER